MQPPSKELGPDTRAGSIAWQHAVGVGLFGGGIALGVCRLVLLPFGQGTSSISVVIGLATGLIVAGIFQMRNATPKAPIATSALAFIVGAATVTGTFFIVFPPAPPLAELALARQNLPGLDAHLPEQEPTQSQVSAESGVIKYERPAGRSGAISLEWQPGDTWSKQDVDMVARALLESLDPNAQVTTSPLQVAGQAGFTISLSNDRMEMRGALWNCPGDGRLFNLWCGFSADPDKVQALFDRLVAGLACTSPPDQAQGQAAALASLPAIGTQGFGVMEASGYVQLANLNGEFLLVQHNRAGNLGKLLTEKPDLLDMTLGAFARNEGVRMDFDHTPRFLTAQDGQRRPLWLVKATDQGDEYFMVMSVVDCEARRSYLLMYLREAGEGLDQEAAARKLLATIGCPGPTAEPPPKFADMAQKACDGGDGRGCFRLADLYQTADPDDPRAGPLLKRACELGLTQACQPATP